MGLIISYLANFLNYLLNMQNRCFYCEQRKRKKDLNKKKLEKQRQAKEARKKRIQRDEQQAMNDGKQVRDEDAKVESYISQDNVDLNTKQEVNKKKPKTHFRKTKKPGRS